MKHRDPDENQTSVHFGGFHFYITWVDGRGVDQHGRKWINKHKPQCDSHPWLKAYCEAIADTVQLLTNAKLV